MGFTRNATEDVIYLDGLAAGLYVVQYRTEAGVWTGRSTAAR